MEKCCDNIIIPFANQGTMNIAYSLSMRSRFGKAPHIRVYHKDGTEYVEPMIEIRMVGNPVTLIKIDNGGAATGFVKLFR